MLTNTGWKAVAIGPNTVANFPQSLNPSSIYLGGATDSFNVLLLNYAGFNTPLSTTMLSIGSNAALTSLSSAVTVADRLSIGGALNQGDYSTLTTAQMSIGDIGPGACNMTNGSLLATGSQTMGGNFSSYFRQYGGTNYPASLVLQSGGEYDMYGGDITAARLIFRGGSGTFNQLGGVVKPDRMYVTTTTYVQAGGIFSSSEVDLPGITSVYDYADLGYFLQMGGSNSTSYLSIGNYYPPFFNASAFGGYTLSNGVLNTSTTSLGPWGGFTQSGGTHSAGGLGLQGTEVYIGAASYPSYSLSGGTLSCGGIGMSIARFSQTGGTNHISGNLTMTWNSYYNSSYALSGGVLQASNTTITSTTYGGGGFGQSGGTQVISNLLTVSRFSPSSQSSYVNAYLLDFLLTGGQLIAQNIEVDSGATFHHRGGTIVNSGSITLSNGNWEAYSGQQQLGKLILNQGTNSEIYLPPGAAVLRFANSSTAAWGNPAMLAIEGWHGSVNGGGAHQIYFGTNSTGLSPQQLAQIQFLNPAGSSGSYPAAILASGEIVPSRFIASQQAGSNLQISWASGMRLQSATNPLGPYVDVSSATSPYTVLFTSPQRFFRLRQ